MTLSLTCDSLRWLAFPGLRDNIILTRHILYMQHLTKAPTWQFLSSGVFIYLRGLK